MSNYEVVIGIETHVQLATRSKLFCGCDNDSRETKPNVNVCPVCLGMPGALPVLNGAAVRLALKAGVALNAYEGKKEFHSKFDRKNYFYPDSPMNYQITQFDEPIVGQGYVEFPVAGKTKKVGITRAHLEADAGKLTHPAGKGYSLVDLNRAGTPLLEIVSEPDMRSAEQAKAYAQELYNLMRYAGVSDADLYYGNMRFDVNVSLRPAGAKQFGTRTESKNLNSFRAVAGVVEYETKRQSEILDRDEKVVQETRGWNEDKRETFSQRNKEESHDYRYFPEPDLPPLIITAEMLKVAAGSVRPLSSLREKVIASGIDSAKAESLITYAVHSDKTGAVDFCSMYLEAAEQSGDQKINTRMFNWIVGPLKPMIDIMVSGHHEIMIDAGKLLKVAQMQEEGTLSSTAATETLADVMRTGENPEKLAKVNGRIQVSDSVELEKIVDQVISENPKPAEDYRSGEAKALGFLVGQVMKLSKGQANPPMVNDIIKKRLGG